MKIIVGIASDEGAESACALLAALAFPSPELHFVNVINLYKYVTVDTTGIGGFDYSVDLANSLEERAQSLLENATNRARQLGFVRVEAKVMRGDPGAELMAYADSVGAAIIALYATAATPAMSFLSGSVARKVAIAARQSVLFARPVGATPRRPWQGSAVFATDQSPYANACADLLARLAPHGLKNIRVLTAIKRTDREDLRALGHELGPKSEETLATALAGVNLETAERFAALGARSVPVVKWGDIHAEIAAEMTGAHPADLLILGSQGKGFFARLSLGSTSLRQVETGDYPIMVLREEKFAP